MAHCKCVCSTSYASGRSLLTSWFLPKGFCTWRFGGDHCYCFYSLFSVDIYILFSHGWSTQVFSIQLKILYIIKEQPTTKCIQIGVQVARKQKTNSLAGGSAQHPLEWSYESNPAREVAAALVEVAAKARVVRRWSEGRRRSCWCSPEHSTWSMLLVGSYGQRWVQTIYEHPCIDKV